MPLPQVPNSFNIGQVQQAPAFQNWSEHAVPALVTPQRAEQQQDRQDSTPADHCIDISALTSAQDSPHMLPAASRHAQQQQQMHAQQSMHSRGLMTAPSSSRSELAQQQPPVHCSASPFQKVSTSKSYQHGHTNPPALQAMEDTNGRGLNRSPGADEEAPGTAQPSGCSPKSALLRSARLPMRGHSCIGCRSVCC